MTSREINRLTDITGIGESVANKLVNHFGTEAKALDALANSDLGALCEIEGISEKGATRLIRRYNTEITGEDISNFLCTTDAQNLYYKIVINHIHILQRIQHPL